MEFADFVSGYRSGVVRVYIDRTRAVYVCDKSTTLPFRYQGAHFVWKAASSFLIFGGLIALFWIPWWAGLMGAALGVVVALAAHKSASQFVLEFSLEDASFFRQMLESGVLKVEPVNKGR